MNIIISAAIGLIVKWISDSQLSGSQITRVKNLISDLEGRAIDSVIKHQSVADLIKSFATGLSNTAVDTIVKLLLLAVRANG
mgnify:CR=1 FL=1